MANAASKTSTALFFGALVLVLIALVGLGVLYLGGDEEPIFDEEQVEARRPNVTGTDAETFDALDGGLELLGYLYEPAQEVITGSAMNNSTEVFAEVKVAFALYNAEGTEVGTVADTTSEIESGAMWQFSVNVPPDQNVSRV